MIMMKKMIICDKDDEAYIYIFSEWRTNRFVMTRKTLFGFDKLKLIHIKLTI